MFKESLSLPTSVLSDKVKAYAKQHDIDVSYFHVTSNVDDMQILKTMIEKGTLKPHVFNTFAFAELHKAHRQVETNHTVDKVMVEA